MLGSDNTISCHNFVAQDTTTAALKIYQFYVEEDRILVISPFSLGLAIHHDVLSEIRNSPIS